MSAEPYESLGELLNRSDALELADALTSGESLTAALGGVAPSKRNKVGALLAELALDHHDAEQLVGVLRAIAGAKKIITPITAVWTLPDGGAVAGQLHAGFHTQVAQARQSVTCATYNFAESSTMRDALRELSEKHGVAVTIYVDGEVGDASAVKKDIPKAAVYESVTSFGGKTLKSHAKFIVIDHTVVLVTSANFSWSAENANVEFGLKIEFPRLARQLEETMEDRQGTIYIPV